MTFFNHYSNIMFYRYFMLRYLWMSIHTNQELPLCVYKPQSILHLACLQYSIFPKFISVREIKTVVSHSETLLKLRHNAFESIVALNRGSHKIMYVQYISTYSTIRSSHNERSAWSIFRISEHLRCCTYTNTHTHTHSEIGSLFGIVSVTMYISRKVKLPQFGIYIFFVLFECGQQCR